MAVEVHSNIKQRYDQDGFYVFSEPLLDAKVVDAAREGMEKVRRGEYDTGRPPHPSFFNPSEQNPNALCKIEQAQFASNGIRELLRAPKLGETVAAIMGAEMVQVWWVQLLYKPPAQGDATAATKVGWHRDWAYWSPSWNAAPSEVFTVWFALSDVNEDSGPVRFVPGSHQWEALDGGNFNSQEIRPEDFTVPPGETWVERAAVMSAGGMSLHHVLTLHGSGQNTSNAPRRSFAIHMRTEKSRPATGERAVLATYIDDLDLCPIIYGEKVPEAFER